MHTIFSPLINRLGKIREERNFSNPPIIIGGCGRSGTTLLLSILDAHPEVFAFPDEMSVFNHWNKKSKNIKPQRFDRIYRYLLTHRIPGTAKRWCEKTPRNVRFIQDIFDYYNEDVYFIHIIRDGRDVVLSKHPSNPDEYWISPQRWVRDVKAGMIYKKHPKVLTIKYEDLIENYPATIKKICNFADLEITPKLENWFEHTQVRKNNAWHNGLQKLHGNSIGKWQEPKYKKRVDDFMRHEDAVELLKELGYH